MERWVLSITPILHCSGSLRDDFKFWFDAKSFRRAKNNVQFRDRAEAQETIWFVALAKEQLALVTDDWFHGSPLVKG
jgi:hypothetical protein